MDKNEHNSENYISSERERIAAEYRKLAFGDGESEIKCSEKLKALSEYSRVLDGGEEKDSGDGGLCVIVIYDYE